MASPSDGGSAIQILDYLFNIVAGVIGAALGAVGLAIGWGRKEGKTEVTQSKIVEAQVKLREDFERHVEKTEVTITKLHDRTENIRDQFADVKANMATRADIAALTAGMQAGFAAVSARMDNVAHPTK